jgi:hypothetical protein
MVTRATSDAGSPVVLADRAALAAGGWVLVESALFSADDARQVSPVCFVKTATCQ